MYKFGRFLTVSVLAICAVSAANATVVTQTRLNTALGDKVNVDQTATNKDKAVITNFSGQITTGTIATGMITDGAVTEGKLASNAVTSAKIANGTIANEDIANGTIAKAKLDSSVQASLGKADTAIQSHQDISGKQDTSFRVTETVAGNGTDGYGYATGTDAELYYPSMATTGAMITNALQATNNNIADLQNTSVKHTASTKVGDKAGQPVYVKADGTAEAVNVSSAAATSESGTSLMNEGAVAKTINALDVSAIGGGGASGIIKQVSEANGKISATAAQIVNADISSSAEIADSKIKLGTVSLPQAGASIATGDALNTALGKLQKQITENASTAANNVTDNYSATGTTPVNGKAVNEALKTLDVSSAGGNGNVIVSISETDGKISATAGKISNAEIDANAAIAVSKISGAEATANKSLAATAVADSTDSAKKDVNYPTVAGAKAIADAAIENSLITSEDNYSSFGSEDDLFPSMKVTGLMITNALEETTTDIAALKTGKVDKVVAADATSLMGRDKDGTAGKVTLTDLTMTSTASGTRSLAVDKATSVASGNTKPVTSGAVYTEVRPAQTNATNQTGYLGAPASTTTAANLTALDGALSTIHPNSGEVKIPSGSATSSTLASIWVE